MKFPNYPGKQVLLAQISILLFVPILILSCDSGIDKAPGILIEEENTSEVKRYEKYEIRLGLENVSYQNPYDPSDIDVYAHINTPSGKEIRINGFYDNYLDGDQWLLRFSPSETGSYSYRVFVEDGTLGEKSRKGKSAEGSFTAVESEHHGWIKPSENNPHYFVHDDGTSFYGIGAYSPWKNTQERFDRFAQYGANLFAIWDIVYGGYVNAYGLIEEELGRYNQEKLGRIDSLLYILEEHDIKLMYAIWPHDLFSKTVWAAQWKRNPYNELVDVDDVYNDSLVWEYQKLKYRYMIARFAHSRSWGIWELINEMNGTDAWAHGRHEECFSWVGKCQEYFRENDPYRHPVTASFSGGFEEYRPRLYETTDLPNIHVYPQQGWKLKYPEDTMRSDYHNYAWASRRFWDGFEKPAIFGEAGADFAYYEADDENYHISYHNKIWATLCNGLASIPIWWAYTHLWEQDWEQMQILGEFVKDIDLGNKSFAPLKVSAEGLDLYVMGTSQEAFGWGRNWKDLRIDGKIFEVSGLEDGTYELIWVDTWTGKIVSEEDISLTRGRGEFHVPELDQQRQDIAFKIKKYQ